MGEIGWGFSFPQMSPLYKEKEYIFYGAKEGELEIIRSHTMKEIISKGNLVIVGHMCP